ncbi:MAG: hypothetical protein KF884_02630 [Fimbriimonadaceae bacterium]|nr:hypothetical protein [Fimbriimonadaceae bacterium]QYK58991.1 MAG: hypothetical protein KF884_02630 [Fimbriimonadaceae bacterium]
MTTPQIATAAVVAICGAMAFFNLVRIKSRGPRAVPMGAAFILFAALVVALQSEGSWGVTVGLGFLLFVALALDAFLAPRTPKRPS